MTKEEIEFLNIPIADMTKEQRGAAFELRERQLSEVAEENKKFKPKIKPSKGPYGIMDSIEMKSMVDGKTYTSKAKYYESLKRNDSHIIEPGEQKLDKQREVQGDFNCRKELKQAIEKHLH